MPGISRRALLVGGVALAVVRCGSHSAEPTPAATNTPGSAATRSPSPQPSRSATATPTPPIAAGPRDEPRGFPLDPALRVGEVTGEVGRRTLVFGAGPSVESYSRDDQPSDDAVRANRCGWNARTHVAYEGQPAVDWYIPPGTPVLATMDGTATLLINTVSNPFDVYGVSREPYIGNPDRARAPVSPFPGPGGGQGIFVRIESDNFRADHAHLTVGTVGHVPATAFLPGFSASTDYAAAFAPLRDYRVATAVARWTVKRGEVIGISGDTGYSEAPHLHYAISRLGAANNLCPTTEAGFADGGWLFKG
jgi:murein DD-endopeptidase MepM/ murein hydrolase activator NlpD